MRARGADSRMSRWGEGNVAGFAEMLTVGLAVTAMSLPLVTFVPALAAGVWCLGRRSTSLRELFVAGWQAIRAGWVFGVVSSAAMALLLMNVLFGATEAVPGGQVLSWASLVLAVAVLLVSCRTAGLWRPGMRWSGLRREAQLVLVDDPVGDVFVLIGIAVAVAVVWMLPAFIVIAPGLIVVSVVAAERRRASLVSE